MTEDDLKLRPRVRALTRRARALDTQPRLLDAAARLRSALPGDDRYACRPSSLP